MSDIEKRTVTEEMQWSTVMGTRDSSILHLHLAFPIQL